MFAPDRVKEFLGERATVFAGIASYRDDDNSAHTCHDRKEIVPYPGNSDVVLLDILQTMLRRLVPSKAQTDAFIGRRGSGPRKGKEMLRTLVWDGNRQRAAITLF